MSARPPGSSAPSRIVGLLAALAGPLLWVVPDSGSCGGPTLDWTLAEPIAHALGVHGWFREGAALGGLVWVAPAVGFVLGSGAMALGWRGLVASRRDHSPPLVPLAVAGAGVLTSLTSCWAGFAVSLT